MNQNQEHFGASRNHMEKVKYCQTKHPIRGILTEPAVSQSVGLEKALPRAPKLKIWRRLYKNGRNGIRVLILLELA